MARLLVAAVVVTVAAGFWGLGGLAHDCSSADRVIDEGVVQTIWEKDAGRTGKLPSIILYTQQDTDFEGVSVVVKASGEDSCGSSGGGESISGGCENCDGGGDGDGGCERHTAWFPGSCFRKDGQWRRMRVAAEVKKDLQSLEYELNTAECKRKCMIQGVHGHVSSLSVAAHGPSRWKLNKLHRSCYNISQWADLSSPPTMCTTEPPRHKTVVEVGVVVVVVVMLVVVVVVVVLCRRRRRLTTSHEVLRRLQPTEQASHTHDIENNLYESFGGHEDTTTLPQQASHTHVIENNLYESFGGHEDTTTPPQQVSHTHVIENNLYESFGGHEDTTTLPQQVSHTHVIENNLYESVGNHEDTTMPPQQASHTHVIENNLYESVGSHE